MSNRRMDRMTEAEFETLVEGTNPFLFRVLTPWAFSREILEDIVQEVWLKVHRALPRFQGRSALRTWIYRIAVNTAANWKKRQREHPDEEMAERMDERPQSDPEAVCRRNDLRERLRAGVEKLRPAEREIFLLRAWEEMSFAEIAGAVGSTEVSVRVRYFKIVRKMRNHLAAFQEAAHEDG